MLSKRIFICFDCPYNEIRCNTCKNNSACLGCEICMTDILQPCIHCDILCKSENDPNACQLRDAWIKEENKEMSIMKSVKKNKWLDNKRTDKQTDKSSTPIWGNTGLECISECPHKTDKVKMLLHPNVASKLTYLQTVFKETEFLVAGNAELIDNNTNTYLLSDIVVPQQVVGISSVDNIKYDMNYNTVIHKHPGTNPGRFSIDDHETVNGNHDFSILIGSYSLEHINGVGRIKIECGRYMSLELTIDIMLPDVKQDQSFLEQIKNIKKRNLNGLHVDSQKDNIKDWHDRYDYW